MSALYALDYCVAPAALAKQSEDFAAIVKLKLRIPARADWQAAREAGELTLRCMENMEHAVIGFILGIACDASAEDIQAAARFMFEQGQLLQSHFSQQMDLKFKVWTYLMNTQAIVDIAKKYFLV